MNPQDEQNNKTEIATIAAEQYPVTPVPKLTTELPFFYFTQDKKGLATNIIYEDVDEAGKPVKWTVTPNRAIGIPTIESHEVWTRLIKPTWEAYRIDSGQLPNILPLGGVRHCLRVLGWCEGGWEARRLLKVIRKIGATWCTADFLVPTTKRSDRGEILFRPIKGEFSRLTIYAIGEKHLTEEDFADDKFNFKFDLDDTLYVLFNPVEVAIQESQPQRYLDNQYMFSVRPSGRRWYELMHGKIYGVVKNGGDHCDIRYSWYIKCHHTLTRHTARWKVMEQMNDIIRDHLDSGFIKSVEYRPIKEPAQEIDFLIRYYPGKAAKESVTRVLRGLRSKPTLPEPTPRTPRRKKQEHTSQPVEIKTQLHQVQANGEVTEVKLLTAPDLNAIPSELLRGLSDRGVMGAVAILKSLSTEQLDRAQDVIEYWDRIRGNKGPGLLMHLIKTDEPLPPTFVSSREQEKREIEAERRRQLRNAEHLLENAYEVYKRETVDHYIRETVSTEEYSQRIEAEKERIKTETDSLFAKTSPELITRMAEAAVEKGISKQFSILPFEEFRRREARRILAPLGIDPAELGITIESLRAAGEPNQESAVTSADQNRV